MQQDKIKQDITELTLDKMQEIENKIVGLSYQYQQKMKTKFSDKGWLEIEQKWIAIELSKKINLNF